MISLILRTAARYLLPLLLLFSLFLVLRGHNEPGGGFVGGLVISAALVLYALAYDVPTARNLLWCEPPTLIGIGLLTAGTSGLPAVLSGQPFMTGQWVEVFVSPLGTLYLGTPLLFDIGVYLVVLGATLTIIFTLAEQ